MSIRIKLLSAVGLSLVFLFLSWALTYSPISQQIREGNIGLGNGDKFIVYASGPVDIRIWATRNKMPSQLLNSEGQIVMATQSGVMPGYFEASGTITPGTYTLVGEPSAVVVSGQNFISAEAPEALNDIIKLIAFCLFILLCVWGLVVHRL